MQHFFEIKPVKNTTKLNKFLDKTKKELGDFFDVNPQQPLIFFYNSRKEIDQMWQRKTAAWECAWALNGNIYILNPKVFAKESNHKIEDFWKVIKHECCHLYFKQLTGINYPSWLNEGLACYLAKQNKKAPSPNEAIKVFNYFKKADNQVYQLGYFWVKLLLEKFGQKKFLRLLKQFKSGLTERQFRLIFHKTYGFKFDKSSLAKFID